MHATYKHKLSPKHQKDQNKTHMDEKADTNHLQLQLGGIHRTHPETHANTNGYTLAHAHTHIIHENGSEEA